MLGGRKCERMKGYKCYGVPEKLFCARVNLCAQIQFTPKGDALLVTLFIQGMYVFPSTIEGIVKRVER